MVVWRHVFSARFFWDGLQPPTSNLFLVVSGSRSFLHLPPASQVPDLKAHLQIRGLSEVGPGRNLGQWGIDTYLSLLTWADKDRNDMFFTARRKMDMGMVRNFQNHWIFNPIVTTPQRYGFSVPIDN